MPEDPILECSLEQIAGGLSITIPNDQAPGVRTIMASGSCVLTDVTSSAVPGNKVLQFTCKPDDIGSLIGDLQSYCDGCDLKLIRFDHDGRSP